MAVNEDLLSPFRAFTPENREALAQRYLGRGYEGPDDVDAIMQAVNQSIAGQAPGTKDASGFFSVPTPDPWYSAGNLIPALALGGTLAGAAGLFGGAGGGAAAGAAPAAVGTGAFDLGGVGALGSADAAAAGLGGAGAAGGATLPGAAAALPGAATAAGGAGSGAIDPYADFDPFGGTPGIDLPPRDPNLIPGVPNNVLGGAAQGIFGWIGANKQANAFENVSNQNLALGAPSRDRFNQSFEPGFNLLDQPGMADALQRAADISAKAANVTYGNPYDAAPQAKIMNDVWSQNFLPALGMHRGQLLQGSNLGLGTAGAAQLAGAGVADDPYAALAGGAGRIFGGATMPSYEDLLRQVGQPYNLNIGGSNPFGRK